MIMELAPGVFSLDHRTADGKNGVIFGRRGALAIDVGTDVEEGRAAADFIRSTGGDPTRVILTHGHSDHVLGGQAFAGAEVFAHVQTPGEIRRQLQGYALRKALSYETLLEHALWPTVMFTDELLVDLGDKHLRVFPTPGHCAGHVSVYLEEVRILFAGDCVVTGIVPAIGDGDSRALESSLRRLMTLDIDILVPGHGQVVCGAALARDWLQWLADYLSRVRAFVRDALDRAPDQWPDSIADQVDFEAFIGSRLPADRHEMPARHRGTVLKIIAEERGQTGTGEARQC